MELSIVNNLFVSDVLDTLTLLVIPKLLTYLKPSKAERNQVLSSDKS